MGQVEIFHSLSYMFQKEKMKILCYYDSLIKTLWKLMFWYHHRLKALFISMGDFQQEVGLTTHILVLSLDLHVEC